MTLLPGHLPPDQLVFEHLYNLPAAHPFWKNDLQFTRDVFTNAAREVLNEFSINGDSVEVKERVAAYTGTKKPREVFKRFYKSVEFQKLLTSGAKPYNPWKHWADNNPVLINEFLENFKTAVHGVMSIGYAVDVTKLAALEVKPRKV